MVLFNWVILGYILVYSFVDLSAFKLKLVQPQFGCFIFVRMVNLILSYFIYFVLLSLYTFSSYSSHIVNTFLFF